MTKALAYIVAFLACGLILPGCGAKKVKPGAPPVSQRLDASKPSAKKPAPDSAKKGAMAAKVNGATITDGDVDQAVNALLGQYGGQIPQEQLSSMAPTMRKQAIETLISQRLLIQEADREKIRPDAKDIDARLKEVSARFPSAEKFKQVLASSGTTEKQLRDDITQDLKIKTLLDKKAPATQDVSDAEVEAFYRDNPDEFKMPERAKASHILIKLDPEDSAEVKLQKRAKLLALRGEIEKGADFAKLASENSDCPSKAEGGDLGFFERGKMVKEFDDAAFSMKEGQLSDVVKTPFGYHLIKITGHENAQVMPLEKVRDKLGPFLNRRKRQKTVADYLQKLRSTAKIEYAQAS